MAENAPIVESLHIGGSPLLHALVLSSATLLLVGVVAKVNSSLQPLDRRKEGKGTFKSSHALKHISSSTLGVLLPFYASLQVGGAKTALVLLIAVAAGLGAVGQSGQQSPWANFLRTIKTSKVTCATLLVGASVDMLGSGDTATTLLGHGSLLVSLLLAPPSLPTSAWPGKTSHSEDSYINHAPAPKLLNLSKPSSPLVNSSENIILTLASGLVLAVVSILYYLVSSSTSSTTYHTIGVSILSVASATALVYFSCPSALQTQKRTGLKLGGLFIAGFSLWEHRQSSIASVAFLWVCASFVAAVVYDRRTPALPAAHSHGHSHSGHKHSHKHDHAHDHDHHLHGNHSRLSAFLIARATPGSIIHSVLIEKDSRRIAYFGV